MLLTTPVAVVIAVGELRAHRQQPDTHRGEEDRGRKAEKEKARGRDA